MNTDKKAAETEDRRIRRTKSLLRQGLILLLEKKEIKDISVKELSELADINRGTFYLHYRDIYDMLSQLEDGLFTEFNEILDRTITVDCPSEDVSPEDTLLDIFFFLERHKDLVKVLMGPHGDLAFVNRMKDLVKVRIYNLCALKQPPCDHSYIEAFTISGCVGVIQAWLNHPTPQPPEEMAAICSSLLMKGLKNCS